MALLVRIHYRGFCRIFFWFSSPDEDTYLRHLADKIRAAVLEMSQRIVSQDYLIYQSISGRLR